MSDSLREQLLKAGFAETAPSNKKPGGRRPSATKRERSKRGRRAAEPVEREGPDAELAARRALKQKIRSLIESTEIDKGASEQCFRYLLGGRIREMHVARAIHRRLVAGELGITRLNGRSCIVPGETLDAIAELNPDWARMTPASEQTVDSLDERYRDYIVPDDLQW